MILAPDFGFGGAERSAAALSKLLSKTFEVYFMVFNTNIKRVYELGGVVLSLDVGAGRTIFQKALHFLKRIRRLRRFKKELGIHICLSFLEGADYVNVLSRKNEKVILNVRGSKRFDPNISGFGGWIRRSILIPLIYNHANALTTVSKGLRDELLMNIGISKQKPIFIIPNFYNVDELRSRAKEKLSNDWEIFFKDNQTIITVGRISHEKGFDLLVPVFEEICKVRPETRWIIIGEGPSLGSLQQILIKRGISYSKGVEILDFTASVFFVGYQPNPQKWVSRSTIFVLSSLTEGFPNVVLEAMAVGVPVVASDCPYGPSEILSEKQDSGQLRTYGILLPLLTGAQSIVKCWSQHLIDVLADVTKQQQYSRQSVIRSSYYSPELVEQLWHEALLKTLHEEKNTNRR